MKSKLLTLFLALGLLAAPSVIISMEDMEDDMTMEYPEDVEYGEEEESMPEEEMEFSDESDEEPMDEEMFE